MRLSLLSHLAMPWVMITFPFIVVPLQGLQIRQFIRSAPRYWLDVINFPPVFRSEIAMLRPLHHISADVTPPNILVTSKYWIPLRPNSLNHQRTERPSIYISISITGHNVAPFTNLQTCIDPQQYARTIGCQYRFALLHSLCQWLF